MATTTMATTTMATTTTIARTRDQGPGSELNPLTTQAGASQTAPNQMPATRTQSSNQPESGRVSEHNFPKTVRGSLTALVPRPGTHKKSENQTTDILYMLKTAKMGPIFEQRVSGVPCPRGSLAKRPGKGAQEPQVSQPLACSYSTVY